MAYVECKIWPFSDDKLIHVEERWEAMKTGHRYFTVKALIDTSSSENFISKSLADKLGEKYGPKALKHNHYKNKKVRAKPKENSLGTIGCLNLSFRYKGKDRLVSGSDKALNDFEVIKKPCADLILGIPWLWFREAIIDFNKGGIRIYRDFVPFCQYPSRIETIYGFNSETDSDSESSSPKLRKKVKKLERTVDWIGNYVEEQTGLEPGKEITDSSDSDYAPPEKKAKPRRNLARAVRTCAGTN